MTKKINVSGIINESIVDGDGVRLTVFLQGCFRHCKGCHNPDTWEDKEAQLMSTEEIMEIYDGSFLLDGITLSGGEPFLQADKLVHLVDEVHKAGGNVWCYTGYTLQELQNMKQASELLKRIDVLVDGPFIESERDLTLKFRGSRNQNIWKNMKGTWTKYGS